MQRKQRRHHEAAAAETRCPLKYPEEYDGVQHMQQQIHIVRAGGIEIEELAIERVRKPGDGMPRADMIGGEGPAHGVPGEAVLHVRILRDVESVVVVDEGIVIDAGIERDSDDDEGEAEHELALPRRYVRRQLGCRARFEANRIQSTSSIAGFLLN